MSIDRPVADSRLCLATVTTDSFVPGTLVTLHSFLKHNRWFKGDIVIIHDELAGEYRQSLLGLYDKVRFLQVNPRLQTRVDEVTAVFPEFAPKQARFYSLETFRVKDYDKVLFCDSDLLFRQPIQDLFDMPHALIACGDGAYYQGRGRRWGSGVDGVDPNNSRDRVLHNTFNSGLFLVDRALLTDDHYAGLLKLVDSRIYQTANMKLADQVVLNLYFAGRQHLVSGAYNYLLEHRATIYEREGLGLTDARVLHFNGLDKPWLAHDVLRRARRSPAFIKACGFWYEGYVECLEQLYLNAQGHQTSTSLTQKTTQ